jgi:hypothetical protein
MSRTTPVPVSGEDQPDPRVAGPRLGPQKFPVAPYFYPRFLRRVADALEALDSIGDSDERGVESPHFTAAEAIALWNEELLTDNSLAGLEGWLTLIDQNRWVFVPYIEAVEFGGGS